MLLWRCFRHSVCINANTTCSLRVIINPVWSAAVSAQQQSIYRFLSRDKKSAAGSMRRECIALRFLSGKKRKLHINVFLACVWRPGGGCGRSNCILSPAPSPRSRYKVMPAPGRLLSMRLSRSRAKTRQHFLCWAQLCGRRLPGGVALFTQRLTLPVLKGNPVYKWH